MSHFSGHSPTPGQLHNDVWTTETPYLFPIPKRYDEISTPQRDPWFILYDAKRREEANVCMMWKDEIQSLLTFSGLFSAVLTGFLATTYKDLQPGPNEDTAFLLTQIALRMDVIVGLSDSSTIPPLAQTPPIRTSAAQIRMHATWFLSLVLSLCTAAIGILCLQWIREYERANTDLSFKQGFALQSMRRESFKQWGVPGIIALLPFLLQISLSLFFIGMVDFLLPLGSLIALPTIMAIVCIFALLICTTIAPALQTLVLLHGGYKLIPVPSPYKSPQAWYLLRLMHYFLRVVVAQASFARSLAYAPWIHSSHPKPASQRTWKEWCRRLGVCLKKALRPPCTLQHQFLFEEEWKTEVFWMGERNSQYSLETSLDTEWMVRFRADWDAARGLAYVIDHTSLADLLPFVIYHCFDELPVSLNKPFFESISTLHIVDEYNVNFQGRRLLPFWSNPSPQLKRVEDKVLLLNSLTVSHAPKLDHLVVRHQMELYIRLLSGIFAEPWLDRSSEVEGSLNISTFRPRLLRPGDTPKFLCITDAGVCLVQLARVFEKFVVLAVERAGRARLGQHHQAKDIAFLVELVVTATKSFAESSIESRRDPNSSMLVILSILTKTQETMLRFLTTPGTQEDVDTFTKRVEIVFVTASQLLRFSWLHNVIPVVQALGAPATSVRAYTQSFGLLLQWCDTFLPQMHATSASMGGLNSKERLGLLRELGLVRISLTGRPPFRSSLTSPPESPSILVTPLLAGPSSVPDTGPLYHPRRAANGNERPVGQPHRKPPFRVVNDFNDPQPKPSDSTKAMVTPSFPPGSNRSLPTTTTLASPSSTTSPSTPSSLLHHVIDIESEVDPIDSIIPREETQLDVNHKWPRVRVLVNNSSPPLNV